ncbi:MAG TPA: phosphatidylglycerol lysyltransferase domain-containing protein [Mycobacteriales bacterium]|nr:phosphatidylglycerol lysyltransferase domain-containing protein [Mycobacteriales bacterium]
MSRPSAVPGTDPVGLDRTWHWPWVPRLAGWLATFIGLLDIGSGVTPGLRGRVAALNRVLPGAITHAATALTIVVGILFLLLAHGLRRRKRRAWQAVVALLAISVVLHVVKGFDIEEATISVVLLAASLLLRAEFPAAGDPRTRWSALLAFFGLLALSVGLGFAMLAVRRHDLIGAPSLSTQLGYVLKGLIGVTGHVRFRNSRVEDIVSDSLVALGVLIAMTTAYLALRPPEPLASLGGEDERRMRELLGQFGTRDSLGYFALRRDKNVVWSTTGKSCIAYRVVSGVMLASGDPLGDPEAWPGAIAAFLADAHRHAWVPAVMGCSELGGEVWTREAGLSALELGDEAIIEVCDFSLEGRAMRNVRQAAARVERAGYCCRLRRVGDIPPAEIEQLRMQAAAWRGAQTERGFSMALGRFGDPADRDCVAVTAERDGTLCAFLHFAPWGRDGLSLDVMRRDRSADNGLNEFLIVETLRCAPDLGVRRISLNFAVFRSALERGERLGAGPVLKAWRGLLVFISRWFQIESLYRFNAKFRPIWEPRFICYPSARDLPRIAVAALEAEAFIVWPRPALRRLRRLAGARSA